jgi:hypothetical protein
MKGKKKNPEEEKKASEEDIKSEHVNSENADNVSLDHKTA